MQHGQPILKGCKEGFFSSTLVNKCQTCKSNDTYIMHRNLSFIEYGLDMEWVWYRFEYQARGTVHIHGGARLRSDPGLTELGEAFVSGKLALRVLCACFEHIDDTVVEADVLNALNSMNHWYDVPFIERTTDSESIQMSYDEFKQPLNSVKNKHVHEFLNEETRTETTLKYIDIYKKGVVAEKKICRYRDYLLTTNHPDPPVDHARNERDPSTKFVQHESNCHPCSTISEENIFADDDTRKSSYSNLCSFANRHWYVNVYIQLKTLQIYMTSSIFIYHRCNNYCRIANKPCRFGYPKRIQTITTLQLVEKKIKKGNGTIDYKLVADIVAVYK